MIWIPAVVLTLVSAVVRGDNDIRRELRTRNNGRGGGGGKSGKNGGGKSGKGGKGKNNGGQVRLEKRQSNTSLYHTLLTLMVLFVSCVRVCVAL